MSEIEDLLKDVETLRTQLEQLINEHSGNLTDPEVIAASKVLNGALNQYNKLIKDRMKTNDK